MLRLANVDVSIQAVHILRDVSLELPTGTMAGLVGRNGAGKTTLMKSIMGLLHASRGAMDFDGQDLRAIATHQRTRLGIGYMPEDRKEQGLVLELILTFFLVNTVMNAGISGKATIPSGLAIGFTLTFGILMAGPLTGGSLNPARTLGPAVATGSFADLKSSAGLDDETALDPERDAITYYFYDGQGRQTGILDAEGYLTETVFNLAGHVAERIRYDGALTHTAGATLDSLIPPSALTVLLGSLSGISISKLLIVGYVAYAEVKKALPLLPPLMA